MRRPALLLVGLLMVSCGIADSFRRARADQQVERGGLLFTQGKYAQAEKTLLAAVESGALPTERRAEAWTMLGNARYEQDDYEGAVTAHRNALEAKPKYAAAWVNKGVALRALGKLDEAGTCYQEAIELDPDYAEAYASLGALHIFRDEPAEAIQVLEHAIALEDGLAVAHANLSLAYALSGRQKDADSSLNKAIIRGYKNADALRARFRELRDRDGELR